MDNNENRGVKLKMKVKELIELLQTCDPNETMVMICGDGDRFSPLSNYINRSIYRPDNNWWGDIVEYEHERKKGDIDVVVLGYGELK